MKNMKNNLVWYLVYLLIFLVCVIAFDFFKKGIVTSDSILLIISFAPISFLIIIARKNLLIRWISIVLGALGLPIMLIGFITIICSLFSFDLADWTIIPIYIAGFIVVIYWMISSNTKQLDDSPFNLPGIIDERNTHYIILSGFGAFIFLNFLIIGALLQPWLPLDDLRLWIGVLITGLLFWIITASILEMKY